ncbi:hypothetical protein C7974DRAFT_393090 [Boeremia exigua]|uniref:uncharacterized protein n=1 Tax=Boeremia exigua TaxID=749465 RepID=UPI001E8CD735|nr:uncharacterized protein C7974DRAFT_393090 [Boeremia exigua]KAH6633596.1 hypothetical protein C7974DRAFT_393090 [Boeremia exigua]
MVVLMLRFISSHFCCILSSLIMFGKYIFSSGRGTERFFSWPSRGPGSECVDALLARVHPSILNIIGECSATAQLPLREKALQSVPLASSMEGLDRRRGIRRLIQQSFCISRMFERQTA